MARRNTSSAQVGTILGAAVARAQARITGDIPVVRIAPQVTFREWCESLARDRIDPTTGKRLEGLKVDGEPFKLDDRPAMAWIYDQIPSTPAEAYGRRLILMKCAQVGFTVMEILAAIFMALKFGTLKVGFFLPDMSLAKAKSADRFMPIIRTIPEAYDLLTQPDPLARTARRSEGNMMLRTMGRARFHFLWTTGRSTTESFPMDFVAFDEVQNMAIGHMEKALERMSASRFKFTLMGSTANHPASDIDYFFRRGSQHRFHTRCPSCGVEEPLDAYFPECIAFDPDHLDPRSGASGAYRYQCRAGHWIDDPQQGAWRSENPDADAKIVSIHFHQMLSPTVSPGEIIRDYFNAHDIKSFFNRKLGKPYQDPSEHPVTQAHLDACEAAGARMGLTWKTSGKNTFMGIDQMGGFNCVIIKERLSDGRDAVLHVEEIYGEDPFARCTELMADFGVQVCVVEQLPNINDARRFANLPAHRGRVFLCTSYGNVDEGSAHWGDAPTLTASQRRTVEGERDRWTVHIDQHKAMSSSLRRIAATGCLFPSSRELVQEVREKEARFESPILKDRVFPHLLSTALVTERVKEHERRYVRRVEKRGRDPHHAFALMLCDVALTRAYGTAQFLLPDMSDELAPTSPQQHPVIQQILSQSFDGQCGGCISFRLADGDQGERGNGACEMRGCGVRAKDPECPVYQAR